MIRTYVLALLLVAGNGFAYSPDFTNAIAEERLKGYTLLPKQVSDKPLFDQNSLIDMMRKFFEGYASDFKPLDWPNAMKQAWIELGTPVVADSKQLIDHKTIQEIEVIRGSSTDASTILTQITDKKLSVIGEKRGAEMVCMPLCNMDALNRRKSSIEVLAQDEMLLRDVNGLLDTMKQAEPYVIDFYGKDGISDSEKAAYPGFIVKALSLDEIPLLVSFTNRLFGFMTTPALSPLMTYGGTFSVLLGSRVYNGMPLSPAFQAAYSTIRTMSPGINTQLLVMETLFLPVRLADMGVARAVAHAIMRMQERVIGFATYVRAAKELMVLFDAHPQLAQFLPEVHLHLTQLDGQSNLTSEKFVYLNNLLREKSAFDAGEPSFFSSPGHILVAYKYLSDASIRKEYVPIMNTIGEIDVYAALANKVRAHASYENAQICFVDFIEQSEKPMLEINNFWHPFIAPEKAVANSVSLNTSNERNIVITGPNTGGKSTNMKSVAISVLLAQTFGIAPAASMRMTPFNAIYTYLNVIDDTSAGLSLFKAEVKRVQELVDAVKALPSHQYAFIMLDEIFTGTSPEKSAQLSYDCMHKLADYENLIFISATHFKELTELEYVTNGVVKNYQVEALVDENGKVTAYTYKIVPGVSQINSAQQVVEEGGLVF